MLYGGLPSHFGHDPTCLLFRGAFDVSCWTSDFQPKVRIFSTMGQPDWMAAYLSILIPVSLAFSIEGTKNKIAENKTIKGILGFLKTFWMSIIYLLLALFLYVDLMYTASKSGAIGTWASLIIFAIVYFWLDRKTLKKVSFKKLFKYQWNILFSIIGVVVISFFLGNQLGLLGPFTLTTIQNNLAARSTSKQTVKPLRCRHAIDSRKA